MSDLPEHLGGHLNKTHLDRDSLIWVKEKLQVKSMVDIGCGPGGMVAMANSMGIASTGVDGDFTLDRGEIPCIIHDYTLGNCRQIQGKKFDLGWSVEFLEHVQGQYIPYYMDTFQKCHYVICTHALPCTPGTHHVNCQDESYWIGLFDQYGFNYLPKMTSSLRSRSSMNIDRSLKKQFMKNTGKVFENRKWESKHETSQ